MKALRSMACASVLVAAAGGAEGVSFTSQPEAVPQGKGARVSFAVSGETDVEVTVLGAAGKVVRHLAAGRLGAGAPAPLAKGKLAQEIAWDGRDDAGRLYVVDVVNRRIVSVRFEHAAEAPCAIEPAGRS